MNEPKHTRGEAKLMPHANIDVGVDMIGQAYGDNPEQDEANAARLVQGWNLLNRLDEMGVSAEQVQQIIIAARSAEAVLLRVSQDGIPAGAHAALENLQQALTKKV